MPIYDYEAKLITGEMKKGKIEAIDENAAREALRTMNYYPTILRVEGKSQIDLSDFTKVKIKDIAIFCRQFSYIILAGMNVLKALEILKEETPNKRLKKSISVVYEDVQKGRILSASMRRQPVFPEMLVNMIAVGEASGNLDSIMLRMADYYDKEFEQNQKVKQAMTYPTIICIFAVIVVNLLVIKVLPAFIGGLMDNPEELPGPTRIVLAISNFMQAYWILIIILVIVAVILFKMTSKAGSNIGRDKFKLGLPVIGKLLTKIATAKFARTFGMLLNSGLAVINSLEISAKVIGNKYIEAQILEATENIKKGISISRALRDKNIFNTMFIQMITIGEESGTLDDVLANTASFYDKEVETATAQMTTMIEPLIIIVLAAVVGFIILSIIMPMFDMYDAMG
ncbi:type II secretion system F family protein [Clostridium thermarum]|uniref:type II secretion system F family protein n=1 Tax=Clostridium thermarum TaxID=1716543 RepID=UPI0013CF50CA|nr:type II secretion system F family protein [Clostridium thermarum]